MNKNSIIEIGRIQNDWTWEYDQSTITAILLFDTNTDILFLDLNKTHIKSGIGRGIFQKHLGKFKVGSMTQPMKGKINSILKNYKQTVPFQRKGWFTKDKNQMSLNALLIEAFQGKSLSARLLKIHTLKKKIVKT